jgi:hypothetical protein
MVHEVVEVQQGVWIDERWIHGAGLGRHLQIVVYPGEIRILPARSPAERSESSRGWEVFRTLGNDAPRGQLSNAAVEHDRYLYGLSA